MLDPVGFLKLALDLLQLALEVAGDLSELLVAQVLPLHPGTTEQAVGASGGRVLHGGGGDGGPRRRHSLHGQTFVRLNWHLELSLALGMHAVFSCVFGVPIHVPRSSFASI